MNCLRSVRQRLGISPNLNNNLKMRLDYYRAIFLNRVVIKRNNSRLLRQILSTFYRFI